MVLQTAIRQRSEIAFFGPEALDPVIVALIEPADFMAVGQYYRGFRQLDDEEVVERLRTSEEEPSWH